MIVKNVRVDWLFIWEPSKKGKYGCSIMLHKMDPQVEEVEVAINRAIQAGIAGGKFTDAQVKSAQFKKCLRDGDAEIETEGRPKHYAGHVFFNVTNKQQPGIVGPDTKPLMDRDKLYSGCYCHLDVTLHRLTMSPAVLALILTTLCWLKKASGWMVAKRLKKHSPACR